MKHFATLMQIYEPWKGPYGGRNWCPHNSNEGSPHPPPSTSQYCPLTSHSIHLCTELHEELTRSDLLLHFVWKVYLQCGNKWWPGVIFAPYWHFLFNWHLSWLGKKYIQSVALLHWDWSLLYFWPLQMCIFAEEWSTKIHICTNWSDVAKKWMWELSIINLPRTCGNRMSQTVGPVVRHKKVDTWAQLSGNVIASKNTQREKGGEQNQNRVPIQNSQNLTYWWFLAGDIYIQTGHYSIHNDKCLALSKRDESGNLTIMLLAPRSGALSRLAFRGPPNPNPSQSTNSF